MENVDNFRGLQFLKFCQFNDDDENTFKATDNWNKVALTGVQNPNEKGNFVLVDKAEQPLFEVKPLLGSKFLQFVVRTSTGNELGQIQQVTEDNYRWTCTAPNDDSTCTFIATKKTLFNGSVEYSVMNTPANIIAGIIKVYNMKPSLSMNPDLSPIGKAMMIALTVCLGNAELSQCKQRHRDRKDRTSSEIQSH